MDSKRQMRRKRVLENAKLRMEKLKNVQRSPSLAEEYQKAELQLQEAPDPPDEIIPKLPATSDSMQQPPLEAEAFLPRATPSSKLNNAVSGFTAEGVWRCRTLLAVLCGVSVVWLENSGKLLHSSVVLMCALDSALLVYVMLTHHPSNLATARNPLGKISLLKIPLMVVHSASAKWFDTVCLSIWLVALILRDILLMIFTTIVLKCAFQYISSE